MVKVRAHTTWWDVLAGRITARDRAGNHLADQEAKKALYLAKKEAPAEAFNAQLRRATDWAKWLVKYAANFIADTSIDQEQAERSRAEEWAGGEGRQRITMTHEKWKVGKKYLCRRCGREDEGDKPHCKALVDACKGSAGGRALAHATDRPNYVWNRFLYTEGELMLKGATLVQTSRVPEAMVEQDPREPTALAPSRREVPAREIQDEGVPVPWMQDPEWLYLPHLRAERGTAGGEGNSGGGNVDGRGGERVGGTGKDGHILRTTGPLIWCARCACHALQRLGTGLKGTCTRRENDATKKRLQRLHAGRHPVSGRPLSFVG